MILKRLTCRFLSGAAIVVWAVTSAAVAQDEKPNSRAKDDYELMKLFVETYEQIDANYVRDVDRRELMEAAIRGMLQHLDQYSTYIPRDDISRFDQVVEQEFGGIGIQVNGSGGRLTVVSPLPGTPALRAGIRSGDTIVEVDGRSTEGFNVSDAVKVLQGPPGRPVKLGIRRPGQEEVQQFELVREVIQVPTVLGDRYDGKGQWEFMLDEQQKFGYLRVTHFSRHTVEELRRALDGLVERGLKGLVLDLRSNPGGLLEAAIEISDMFLESGTIVSVKGRNVPERLWTATKGDSTYPQFPIAVLVNRFSASASEVLSACLQDNARAAIIGERTWGKGSVQNVIRLESGDSALKLTTAGYHRPSGVNIDRFTEAKEEDDWGVKPSEGFELSLTPQEWEQWITDREQTDVLRADGVATPERTFKDPLITKATGYLADKISAANAPKEAKSAEK